MQQQIKQSKRKLRISHFLVAFVIFQMVILPLSPIVIGHISFQFFTVKSVSAADGSAGGVAVSTSLILEGLPLAIEAYDLEDQADYLLNHTNDATGVSFTASGSTFDWAYPNVASPSSGSTIVVTLRAQSAGTLIASASTVVFSITDFLVTAVIISAAVFVLIVVVVKRIARKG